MAEYVLIYATDVLSLNRENILLIRKDRPEWQKGWLNLPGGRIEEGETPEQAAVRELKEESGYSVPVTDKVYKVGTIVDRHLTIHVMKASMVDSWIGDPKPRDGETEFVFWKEKKAALADPKLIPNLKVIIPLIESGVHGWTIHDDAPSSLSGTEHSIKISVPFNGVATP